MSAAEILAPHAAGPLNSAAQIDPLEIEADVGLIAELVQKPTVADNTYSDGMGSLDISGSSAANDNEALAEEIATSEVRWPRIGGHRRETVLRRLSRGVNGFVLVG